VIGVIFPNETVGAPLVVMSGGFQADFANSGSSLNTSSARAVAPATATFGGAAAGWTFELPLLGRGTLFRDSDVRRSPDDIYDGTYLGRLSPSGLATDLKSDGGVDLFAPALASAAYRDVSWLTYYASAPLNASTTTFVSGVMGIARPTPTSGIPGTGQRVFTTLLVGMRVPTSDLLSARNDLQVDFAAGSLTGSFDISIACMMGCQYPLQRYTLTAATFDRASGRFTGKVSDGARNAGTFTAQLAGPEAREILLSLSFDFLDPDTRMLVRTDAIVTGRTS
jgi:hypothetical protein